MITVGAYVGPRALAPATIEAVMVTVNSINTCPYCTGLHGELARMASAVVDKKAPEVVYATVFAEECGRGARVQAAYSKLASSIGEGRALSVRALCWALLWGKTTGNTINAVRGKLLSSRWFKTSPFELAVFAFYGPLFLVIGVTNTLLAKLPPVPGWLSTLIGVGLWVPQAVHLTSAGLVSLGMRLLAAPFAGFNL